MPPLFHRREIWLPTARGWALLLLAVAALLALVLLGANRFLAVNAPLPGATVLVVEGWIGENDLDRAAELARRHGYRQVITSGGPIPHWGEFKSYAERAAAYLGPRLPPGMPLAAVPAPATAQERTFASAVWVRDWARTRGLKMDQVDVLTFSVHARRTRLLYEMAFGPDSQIGVIALAPQEYDAKRWWRNSQAFKTLLLEALSLGLTECCFWPGAAGSHEERWAVPPAP